MTIRAATVGRDRTNGNLGDFHAWRRAEMWVSIGRRGGRRSGSVGEGSAGVCGRYGAGAGAGRGAAGDRQLYAAVGEVDGDGREGGASGDVGEREPDAGVISE